MLWVVTVVCLVAGVGLLAMVAAGNSFEQAVGGQATTDDDDARFTVAAVALLVAGVACAAVAVRSRPRTG